MKGLENALDGRGELFKELTKGPVFALYVQVVCYDRIEQNILMFFNKLS